MAADGSLKFDTKINTEGFEAGISSLKDAMERLIKSVDGLSNNMIKSFTGIGTAASDGSKGVDRITEAAGEAEHALKKTQAVQKQTDKSVGTPGKNTGSSISDFFNESTSAGEQLVDQVDRLKEHLYYLERRGLSFGNTDFDETFGALKRAEIALNQYKRELVETEEALNKTRETQERAGKFTGTIHNNTGSEKAAEPGYDYEKEANAILAKNRELQASLRQTSAAAETEFSEAAEESSQLKNMVDLMKQSFMDIPLIIRSAGGSITSAFNGGKVTGETLVDQVDRLKEHLYYLERQGLSFGDADYDKTFGALKRAEAALAQYKKGLAGTEAAQKKVSSSGKKMNTTMKDTKKAAVPLTQSIFKLSNMFKLMLIRMAMRAVVQAAKEGFENLAQYSDATNKSMSMLMSANTRLKNSFATAFSPALEAAAPALKRMIDLLSLGATYAGQFIAALTGKATFVKAVDVQEDYADSIKKTNAEEKKSTKETEKAVAAFDDLIVMQQKAADAKAEDEYKPPTPDQMFETVEIESDIKKFAEFTNSILTGLFAPIKASWAEHGSGTVEAAKTAFNSLKHLAGDVGASFMQVWKTEGYGKQITDDLLITFTNLMLTVSALADRFDEAWMKGENGTNILRHLGDLLLTVSVFFRDASAEIKDWASKLDFEPLLKSFDNLLAKMNPAVKIIGSALLWLLKEALLPLAKWALENGIPAVLDLIAAGFELLASVLNALEPLAMWLWDTFLQPLGKWAGEVFIAALQKIVDCLKKFSNWINEHRSEIESITLAVLSFFAAWKAVEFAGKIITMIGNLGSFMSVVENVISVLGRLDLKFGAIVLVIGTIIYLAAQVAKAWGKMTPGEKVVTSILAVAGALALVVALICYQIKDWAGVMMAGSIAAIAGISIAGITSSANKRSSSTTSSGGGRSFSAGSADAYSATSYRMPRLATGTVVPPRAGEFAAILGDNNRDTEIVSPVPAMKQAFREAIEEMGGLGGNQTLKADLILDGTKFGQLVYRFNNKEKQRVGVRMITEG